MKKISEQKRLELFALYTMALQHYHKTREFERGIARALGESGEYNDAFQDAIYSTDDGRPFDEVLKMAELEVIPPKNRKRSKRGG